MTFCYCLSNYQISLWIIIILKNKFKLYPLPLTKSGKRSLDHFCSFGSIVYHAVCRRSQNFIHFCINGHKGLSFIFAKCSSKTPFQWQMTVLKINVTRKVSFLGVYIKIQSKLCSLHRRHNAVLCGVYLMVLKLRRPGDKTQKAGKFSLFSASPFLAVISCRWTFFPSVKHLLRVQILILLTMFRWAVLSQPKASFHVCMEFSEQGSHKPLLSLLELLKD